jgi:hypothetical protein
MTHRADHLLRYGHRHRQMRERVARSVAAGVVSCARCGKLICPDQQWDLDHADDGGPLEYLGASHSRCNRATATVALDRALAARVVSRDW